ncbi:MAG: ribosomal biogenesis protein [Candidatus Methanomethylophilaceae archaeon]|nr:ribosomal biogenesis protein [Candidatus Methanomethylophilaceae archaeon]
MRNSSGCDTLFLVTKWFGVFLCEENRIVDKRLMPNDPEAVADKLASLQRGNILPEERELAEGRTKLNVSERRQAELGKPAFFDSSFIKASSFGFSDTMMHEVMVRLGRLRTSEPIPKDRNLVQAIRSLDDMIETVNLLNERLHEWYGMHFPELGDYARDRRYAELVAKHGERAGAAKELGLDIESMGSDMEPEDMAAVMSLAETLCRVYDDKERTERYISETVTGVCPNMCALLGGPLSARLISLAGGLDRLATLPSSTVQLLGAEKAMFRHLKSGKKGPKHGVIYQNPEVHRAPYWQRGNIARALAGKVLIAAKIDSYGGEYRGDILVEEFTGRVGDIKRRYPDPPKKPRKPGQGRGGRKGGRGGAGPGRT